MFKDPCHASTLNARKKGGSMKNMIQIILMVLVLTGVQQAVAQGTGEKGDQQRKYHFEEAGKDMPYHLYVPALSAASLLQVARPALTIMRQTGCRTG